MSQLTTDVTCWAEQHQKECRSRKDAAAQTLKAYLGTLANVEEMRRRLAQTDPAQGMDDAQTEGITGITGSSHYRININNTQQMKAYQFTVTLEASNQLKATVVRDELALCAEDLFDRSVHVRNVTTSGLEPVPRDNQSKFMVISYDQTEGQNFWDRVIANSEEDAARKVMKFRGDYAVVVDTLSSHDLHRVAHQFRMMSATEVRDEWQGFKQNL